MASFGNRQDVITGSAARRTPAHSRPILDIVAVRESIKFHALVSNSRDDSPAKGPAPVHGIALDGHSGALADQRLSLPAHGDSLAPGASAVSIPAVAVATVSMRPVPG